MVVTILPCTRKKEHKLFESLPELIHSGNPYYVPPFPGTITKLLGSRSPFAIHGEIIPLIAYREGKPVGRIAAIENRSHNKFYKDDVGFFGFFDSIDDSEVSHALFEAVRAELKKRGLNTLRGPYNPSINEECGLLVEGFESSPSLMMPYNHPYYERLLLEEGFSRARDLYAFYLPSSVARTDRLVRIVERAKRSLRLHIRSVDLKHLEKELVLLRDLYNATLSRNWGFVPVTEKDLEFAAKDLKAIVDPNVVLIAEIDGKPVGFSLLLPNINEFLAKAKSKHGLMRVLSFLWQLKTSHPKQARLAVLGVHPEYRNTGIAAVFYYESIIRGKQRYEGGELSWVDEDNELLMKSLRVLGASKVKTYRLYQDAPLPV